MRTIVLEGKVGSNIVGFTGSVFSNIEFELEEGMRDLSDSYSFPVLARLPLGAKVSIVVTVGDQEDVKERP